MFSDRVAAGRALARRLRGLRRSGGVVLGVPRGGVPVAFEMAKALRLPLDVIVVRKVGVPGDPELAMGAVGEDGVAVVNADVVAAAHVTASEFASAQRRARNEVSERAHKLRDGWDRVVLQGRTVILVDDGAATGATARAACQIARKLGAGRVMVALPVGSNEAVDILRATADEVVCLARPQPFLSVGYYYDDFSPVTDVDVVRLLISHAGSGLPRYASSSATGGAARPRP
ncbi:phosphoribosyltransferase [Paractinoplanes atraurantiacus]|nr:phosphoribosyltransferase family protein [Actinoplanes atraurantiacus]